MVYHHARVQSTIDKKPKHPSVKAERASGVIWTGLPGPPKTRLFGVQATIALTGTVGQTRNFFPRHVQYGIPPVPLALYYLAPSNHYAFVVNCKYSLKSGLITSECSICLCSVVPAVAVLGLRHFSWLPAICPRDGPHGRLVSDINKSTVHWHINLSASICLLS